MAKLLSTIIDGFISSKQFVSGLLGSGWKIWMENDRYKAEFDDLVIRNTMTVFELLISKIRAIKGAMSITQGSGKISGIREDDTNYYITIDEEMSFVADDFIRYMEFNGSKREYWVKVSSVNGSEITVAKNEFAEVAPLLGDELVQFGNATDARRQSAIYLHADENGEPAIDVLDGINGKSIEGKTKLRVGGLDGITDADFPDGINGFGIYSQNGFFKGVIAGAGGYLLRADGTGYIANGSIWWDKEKKVHFENEVVLQWENLSDETKNQLKGDSVFVAYHAGEEEPEKPTGDGTTDGWTIASDANTVWMSQKVSYERDAGEWGNPIRIKGTNADLLPWIQDWNGNTVQIADEYLVSPKIFSGTMTENGTMTGVAFGRGVVTVVENGIEVKKTGIFGVKDGKITFSIDAETGDAMYRGELNVNDNTIITKDGTLTSKKINITGGEFMGFYLEDKWLISEHNGYKITISAGYDNSEEASLMSKPHISMHCPNSEKPGGDHLYLNDPLDQGWMIKLDGNIHQYGGEINSTEIRVNDKLTVRGKFVFDGTLICLQHEVKENWQIVDGHRNKLLCTNASPITIVLPTNPVNGQEIEIKRCNEKVSISASHDIVGKENLGRETSLDDWGILYRFQFYGNSWWVNYMPAIT